MYNTVNIPMNSLNQTEQSCSTLFFRYQRLDPKDSAHCHGAELRSPQLVKAISKWFGR